MQKIASSQKQIGCIFDMDGVLFLSSDFHHQAFCKVLENEPVQMLDYPELSGMRTDSAIQKVFEKSGIFLSRKKLEELVLRKRVFASKMLRKEPPVDPDCKKVIFELYRRGIPLALASSSSSKNVKLFLDSSGTRKYFAVILSGDDVKKGKPDPEIYRTIRNFFGIIPKNCFVVEDSESGIRSAKSDGMNVIGLVSQHSHKELKLFGAVTTICRLDELLKLRVFGGEI